MGMSEFYGDSNDDQSLETLAAAYDLGYRHFDTADMYGKGHNELLLGRFCKQLGGDRQYITIATKVGIKRDDGSPGAISIDSSPEYILKACDRSLERLGVEQIDLYYLHRRNPVVPIDETMSAMRELQSQGKVARIGLSEVSVATLREAHDLVGISAIQNEYSLWSRDVESGMLQACEELNIRLVAYSPLGRGFLSGSLSHELIQQEGDLRSKLPRFQPEAFDRNRKLLDTVASIAEAHQCSLAQVALSWVLHQSPMVTIIPGARKLSHLRDNFGSGKLNLSPTELALLSETFDPKNVDGLRYPEPLLRTTNT